MNVPIGIRPENELLLCLAQTTQDDRTVERCKALLHDGIDWPYLVRYANHHKVIPLLYRSLAKTFPGLSPEDILQGLQYYTNSISRQNLFLVAKLIKLVDFLYDRGISAIPYKGPTLAVLAYGNLSLRQFGDLDLLVDPSDYPRAKEALLENDYRLKNELPWECDLIDASEKVSVDLHRGLALFKYPFRLDFQRYHERLESLSVGGGKIKSFCAEDMLIVLCIQLVKDSWSPIPPLRLNKICDISELLRSRPTLDWELVFKESGRLGCLRIVLLGLTVARELVGAPIPEYVVSMAQDQPNLRFLITHLYENRLFQQDLDCQTASLSAGNLHFKVRERWRDKLHPYWYPFIYHLTPSDKDRKLLKLPNSLRLLYFIIPPIRLARDCGMRSLKWLTEK